MDPLALSVAYSSRLEEKARRKAHGTCDLFHLKGHFLGQYREVFEIELSDVVDGYAAQRGKEVLDEGDRLTMEAIEQTKIVLA
jgi:hypothetical protein